MLLFIAAPSAHRPPNAARGGLFGSGFVAVWLLAWSFLTLAFDVIVMAMVLQTVLAWSYPVASGTITHSAVRHDAGAKGTSILAEVKYQFRVADQDYLGSRLSFFEMNLSSLSEANRVAKSWPVRRQVAVYYNPSDPHDSALDRSLDGRPLFLGVLLLPFNLVMIGGWRWSWRSYQGLRKQPMQLQGEQWIVRRSHGSPFVVGLIAAGLSSFVALFIAGLSDLYSSLIAMSILWLLLMGLTGLAYWHTWQSARSEPALLIANEATCTVSWPATNADNSDLSIAATQLRAVELTESVTTAADGETDFSFAVSVTYLADNGQLTTRPVMKTNDIREAEVLADWLDDWSGLGQRRITIDPECSSTADE